MSHAIYLPGWATTGTVFPSPIPNAFVAPNTTSEAINAAKNTLLCAPAPIPVVGFSMGAMVIAQWLRDPECQAKISTAHLIAPFPHYDSASLAPIYAQLNANPKAAINAFHHAGFGAKIKPDTIQKLCLEWQNDLSGDALKDSLDVLAAINLNQYDYSALTVPVTWSHGLQDKIAPYVPTKRFFKAWPNLTENPMPNGGHFLLQEGVLDALL